MAGPRAEKVAVVEEVREHLDSAGAAILTEYRGLKVGDLAQLRRQLTAAGAEYKIFKNTLVRRATAHTSHAVIDPLLAGPTAIAFVRDDIAAVARVLRDFGRAHPELVVKGGLLGEKLLDARGAMSLADLPSREVLLSQLAGALAAPMRQLAGLLEALPRSFAYGLSALVDKRLAESAGDEPGAAPPAAEDAADSTPLGADAGEPVPAEDAADSTPLGADAGEQVPAEDTAPEAGPD